MREETTLRMRATGRDASSSSRNFISNQRGNSLMVIIGALPLALAFSYYAIHFSQSLATTFHDSRYQARRHAMELALSRSVRSANIVFSSVLPIHQPENATLYRCLFNEPGDLPGDCQANIAQPVAFYDEEGLKLSGSSAASAKCYSEDGMLADTGTDCNYRVWSEMKAVCASGTVACNVAKGFNITFHFDSEGLNFGIQRANRTFDYYLPVADLDYGAVSLITWDFRAPIIWDDGQSLTYTAGPLMMVSTRVGCIDLATTTCGAGTPGLSSSGSTTTSAPPPSLPPPAPSPESLSCKPGYRPTASGCTAFVM